MCFSLFSLKQCTIKLLLDLVFVRFGITKVSVSVIGLSLWLITLTDNTTKIFEIHGLPNFLRYEAPLAQCTELCYYLLDRSFPKKLAARKSHQEPLWSSSRFFWLKHWIHVNWIISEADRGRTNWLEGSTLVSLCHFRCHCRWTKILDCFTVLVTCVVESVFNFFLHM